MQSLWQERNPRDLRCTFGLASCFQQPLCLFFHLVKWYSWISNIPLQQPFPSFFGRNLQPFCKLLLSTTICFQEVNSFGFPSDFIVYGVRLHQTLGCSCMKIGRVNRFDESRV